MSTLMESQILADARVLLVDREGHRWPDNTLGILFSTGLALEGVKRSDEAGYPERQARVLMAFVVNRALRMFDNQPWTL